MWATATIRAQEEESGQHLPIISLTAYAVAGDRDKSLDAGADAYLSKPIVVADLVSTVQELAEVYGLPMQHA